MPGPVSVCLLVTKTVPQLVDWGWGGYGALGGRSFLEEWCYQGCALKVHALPLLLFFLPVCRWKMSSSSFLLGPETLGFPKWLPFVSCHDQLNPPAIVGQSKQILVFYPSEVNWEQKRQGLKTRTWRKELKWRQPRHAAPTVGWAFPHQTVTRKHTHRLAYKPIWWRHLLSWGSFFEDDPSLYHVDKKLTKTKPFLPSFPFAMTFPQQ